MRRDPDPIDFVPVAREHYPLLRTWLAASHMQEWWGDPEEELGFIRDMVEGRDTTRPFLFVVNGVPLGYIQYWFIGHHQNEPWTKDHPWLLELPSDTVGVDLSIGDPERLSQGIGARALAQFVAMLRARPFPHHHRPGPEQRTCGTRLSQRRLPPGAASFGPHRRHPDHAARSPRRRD